MVDVFLKGIGLVILTCLTLSVETAQAAVKLGSYYGGWVSTETYATGDVITLSDKVYLSLVAANTNNNPETATTAWQLLGLATVDEHKPEAAPVPLAPAAEEQKPAAAPPPSALEPQPEVKIESSVKSSFKYSMTCGLSGKEACTVGAVGPGGGWIFFVDINHKYPGFNYLEVAPTDIPAVTWCSDTTHSISAVSGKISKAVGAGKANTKAMLEVCASGAANAANAYLTKSTVSGDWFLPSLGELNLMYTNLLDLGVGGFANNVYWSSSEFGSFHAWYQIFYDGSQLNYNKNVSIPVRAVRAF